jgi:hypothetical protein
VLAIKAVGNRISIYCNHVFVASVTDTSLVRGGIFLAAGTKTKV